MSGEPIYLTADSEIPDLIDRLRRSAGPEVPVVLPAGSQLGQSRFNFELLHHLAGRLGRRVVVVTPDEGAREMAREAGLTGFAALGEYDHGLAEAPAAVLGRSPATQVAPAPRPAGGLAGWAAPPAAGPTPAPLPAPLPPPLPVSATGAWAAVPDTVPAPAPGPAPAAAAPTAGGPPRPILYGGTALVMLAGLAAMAVYVPSAEVTLVAQAQPFTQSFDVSASPGHPPVATRAVSVTDQASQTIQVTGTYQTPGAEAKGTVDLTATLGPGCTPPPGQDWGITAGDTVSGKHERFAITEGGPLPPDGTPKSFPIQAVSPTASANLDPGSITSVDQSPTGPTGKCITVSQDQKTTGGVDPTQGSQMSQDDYNNARIALQKQLQLQVTADLGKQVRSGEKLADQNIVFEPPTFSTDHQVGDKVSSFSATMSVKGDATAYSEADVHQALAADLKGKVKPGYQLTNNAIQSTYTVSSATADGQATFHGSATGYQAPVIDFGTVKGRIAGRSRGSADSYLKSLPVLSASFTQSPLSLPILPWLSSRIEVRYVVEQGQAAPQPA